MSDARKAFKLLDDRIESLRGNIDSAQEHIRSLCKDTAAVEKVVWEYQDELFELTAARSALLTADLDGKINWDPSLRACEVGDK